MAYAHGYGHGHGHSHGGGGGSGVTPSGGIGGGHSHGGGEMCCGDHHPSPSTSCLPTDPHPIETRCCVDSILTRITTDFSLETFWKEHFTFDLDAYGDYSHLKFLLKKYIKPKDSICILGAINAPIGNWLTLNEINDIVIWDKINTIPEPSSRKQKQKVNLKVIAKDIMEVESPEPTYSVLIDRTGIDEIYYGNFDMGQSLEKALTMVGNRLEIESRLLKNFGRIMFLTRLPDTMLQFLVTWFRRVSEFAWIIRIHRLVRVEETYQREKGSTHLVLPVFAVVAIKLASAKDKLLVEATFSLAEKIIEPVRFTFEDCLIEVYEAVDSLHRLMTLSSYLRNQTVEDGEVLVEVYSAGNRDFPRYYIYICDAPEVRIPQDFAIFIVPEGRETEWLFGTPEGRRQLCDNSRCFRLAVCHLARHHIYPGGIERIKAELGSVCLYFAQERVVQSLKDKKVPFLTVNEETGQRQLMSSGHSAISGDYLIEDVTIDNEWYRRLVFLSSQNLIQSEAKLKHVRDQTWMIDPNFLSCKHHHAFLLGIACYLELTENPSECEHNMLLIGLGGGCFVHYLLCNLRLPGTTSLEVIDIDPATERISREWFNLKLDDEKNPFPTKLVIADGLDVVKKLSETQLKVYSVLMLDVNSDDQLSGLSCPPEAFVDDEFIEQVVSLMNPKSSIFMINVVTRSRDRRVEVEQTLLKHFTFVYSYKVNVDVNIVYWCFKSIKPANLVVRELFGPKAAKMAFEYFSKVLRARNIIDPLIDRSTIDHCVYKVR